jgi:hypothetical protein
MENELKNAVKIQIHEPYDTAFEMSIKELAEANGLDYLEAQGFIKSLVKLGKAKMMEPRKVPGAKGKPTNIYLIPTELTFKLLEVVPVPQTVPEPVAA